MKYILNFLLAIFFTFNIFAADYTSTSDGTWTNAGIWSGGGGYPNNTGDNVVLDNTNSITLPNSGVKIEIGQLHFNNNSILTIPVNDTLICDSMVIWNRADLVVDGVLIVVGGVHMNNNSFMNILLDGIIEIGGDLYGANNANLNVDGTMTVDGEIDWNGNTPTGSGTINGSSVGTLPIDLIEFKAENIDEGIKIKWTTASELNNDFFTIEKSLNGYEYEEIAKISGSGTSSALNEYSYIDNSLNDEIVYYRLKQTDFDGQSETFSTISVEVQNQEQIESIVVYNNTVNATFKSSINGVAQLCILNINGQIVSKEKVQIHKGINNIATELIGNKGIYLIRIEIGNTFFINKFVY